MVLYFLGSLAIVILWAAYIRHLLRRSTSHPHVLAAANARNEAMYRTLFPDLQPHYHPARLIHFVRARRARTAGPGTWANPPGFDAASAETSLEAGKERVRLRDPSGAVIAEFTYEPLPEGGVLRVGAGKFTVDIRDAAHPRVRYWHPEREFKWKRERWTFQSRIAEHPLESGVRTRFARGAAPGRGAGGTRRSAAGIDFEADLDASPAGTAY